VTKGKGEDPFGSDPFTEHRSEHSLELAAGRGLPCPAGALLREGSPVLWGLLAQGGT